VKGSEGYYWNFEIFGGVVEVFGGVGRSPLFHMIFFKI